MNEPIDLIKEACDRICKEKGYLDRVDRGNIIIMVMALKELGLLKEETSK